MLQDGCTPLLIATMFKHLDVVNVLLQSGANPDIPDKVIRKLIFKFN